MGSKKTQKRVLKKVNLHSIADSFEAPKEMKDFLELWDDNERLWMKYFQTRSAKETYILHILRGYDDVERGVDLVSAREIDRKDTPVEPNL